MIIEANRLAVMIGKLAAEKKAMDIITLEIGKVSLLADYFVIVSGANRLQSKAIADNITEKLKDEGFVLLHKEGYDDGLWILLDYGYVVVHIFQPEQRKFYNLERLWGHAPQQGGQSLH